jgi:hypothetical protein
MEIIRIQNHMLLLLSSDQHTLNIFKNPEGMNELEFLSLEKG